MSCSVSLISYPDRACSFGRVHTEKWSHDPWRGGEASVDHLEQSRRASFLFEDGSCSWRLVLLMLLLVLVHDQELATTVARTPQDSVDLVDPLSPYPVCLETPVKRFGFGIFVSEIPNPNRTVVQIRSESESK